MAQDFSINFNNLDVLLAIITILVCMLVATSYQINTNRALVSIIFAMMMVGAIAIHVWMRSEKDEKKEQIKELNTLGWMNSILFGLVGFILIALVQFSVIMTLQFEFLASLDPYDRMFGFIAAVTEEWYFRALLLTYVIKLTGEYILSTIIVSGIFTLYHYVVYVLFLGSTTTLAAVFASSLVLCGIFILTRSLTSPVIAHAINNVGLRVVF